MAEAISVVIVFYVLSSPKEPEDISDIVMNFTALLILTELDNMLLTPTMKSNFEIDPADPAVVKRYY